MYDSDEISVKLLCRVVIFGNLVNAQTCKSSLLIWSDLKMQRILYLYNYRA